VLAAHGAVAMSAAREHERAEHLEEALQSSREIGMAVGVLMASGKIPQDEAFDRLRQASQNLHRKLRQIAAEVVDTGEPPDLDWQRSGSG